MFQLNEEDNGIRFVISSEPHQIERVIAECEAFLRGLGVDSFPDLKLVMREMLNNAVEHGNRRAPDKTINCAVTLVRDRLFRIEVEDQGPGFDHAHLDLSIPEDPYQIRNRGLALINSFADRMEFNETGNRVTAYVNVRQETGYPVSESVGRTTVTPSGDMTSATAEAFRQTLAGLAEQDRTEVAFDLQNVRDVDSVCLSVLIAFAKTLGRRPAPARLSLANVSRDLEELFRLTGMDRIYSISREER